MKLKIYLSLTIFLLSLKLYSQDLEYRISMIGIPQEIFLHKDANENYNGHIITEFYKRSKDFLGITLRKYENIKIKTDLDKAIVKQTIIDLDKFGIENIENCEKDAECNSIKFLDGDFLSFQLKSNGLTKNYEFSEVYPENIDSSNIEKNHARRKAQIFITIINKNIDPKKHFKIAAKKIKKPYCYDCGGISSCCTK